MYMCNRRLTKLDGPSIILIDILSFRDRALTSVARGNENRGKVNRKEGRKRRTGGKGEG